MKKIIAIIRNEKVEETKSALMKIGMNGVTFLHVSGRGLQKGMIPVPAPSGGCPPYIGRHPLRGRLTFLFRDARPAAG